MISDNSVSCSATAIQLILQLIIESIVILNPTEACLSGGCCPAPPPVPPPPPQQHCQPAAPVCTGGYSSYAPQTPFGFGASGSYYQPPVAYVNSGNPPPSYASGGLYQSSQNIPASVGSSYSGTSKGTDSGSFYSGGDKGIGTRFGGEGDIVSLTPPPVNIPPPPEQPVEEQSGYDQKMTQTEIKLTPLATKVPAGKPDSGSYKQSENVDAPYAKIVADHDIGQQQKQQSYTEINSVEKNYAKSDIIDYGGGAAAPGVSETQSPQVKLEQPGPEAAYGGETISNIAYQGETSVQKSKIDIAPAISESLKTEIKYSGEDGNTIVESRSIETDDATCNDPMLKAIIESTMEEYRDNLEAARNIESKASKRFGGRFNSIVSDSEFAYVNWYGKRNCQLQVNGRHSLTWED